MVMNNEIQQVLTGAVLEEDTMLTLAELSRACSVRAVQIVAMVEEGILDPCGRDPMQWRFSGASLRRAQAALRVQQDLELNLPGAALVLDLLDRIDALDRRLQMLER